jgi:hypothetical protein
MVVRLGVFTDGDKQWTSLLIDNIQVAQEAVKDIVGAMVSDCNLHAHALWASDKVVKEQFIVGLDTARTVFKNILDNMHKKETLVMNMKGGYIKLDNVTWELLETKSFELPYTSNLLNLLKEQNNKKDEFKLIAE